MSFFHPASNAIKQEKRGKIYIFLLLCDIYKVDLLGVNLLYSSSFGFYVRVSTIILFSRKKIGALRAGATTYEYVEKEDLMEAKKQRQPTNLVNFYCLGFFSLVGSVALQQQLLNVSSLHAFP